MKIPRSWPMLLFRQVVIKKKENNVDVNSFTNRYIITWMFNQISMNFDKVMNELTDKRVPD